MSDHCHSSTVAVRWCFPSPWQRHLLAAAQWSCCSCCSPTTLEANRWMTSGHPRASRTFLEPSLILSCRGHYNNAAVLPELIPPLCSSSGRGGDGAPPLTAQIKKLKNCDCIKPRSVCERRRDCGWKSSAESATTSGAISQDEWLVSGGRVILFSFSFNLLPFYSLYL